MSDADAARTAKAVQEISHQLKELVRVQTVFNENFVTIAKHLKEFMNGFDTVSVLDVQPSHGQEIPPYIEFFKPNDRVRVIETNAFGTVCVIGVEGDDGLPKIEVEIHGSGEKLLFAPEELDLGRPTRD